MQTFAPARPPTLPSRKNLKNSLKTAKFGDGYEMSQPNGINATREMWQLSFVGRVQAEVDYIEAFAAVNLGKTFIYTVGTGAQKLWQIVPDSLSVMPKAGVRSDVNLSLKEVFL